LKVTDPDVIKTGERDLIESIKDDLDLAAVQGILLEKIRSSSFDIKDEALSFDISGGEIVVHDGQIAFRVDCQLKTEMAIMFDRKGNYISDQASTLSDKLESENLIDELEPDEIRDALKEEEISDRLEFDDIPDELKYDDIPCEMEEADLPDEIEPDQLTPDDLLDDLDALEDEDILGDLEDEQEIRAVDPISDLKNLTQNDDFEELLKEFELK